MLKKTKAEVTIAWFSIISIIMGAIVLIGACVADPSIRLPNEFTRKELLLLLGTGLCGVGGQFCLTNALKIESAAIVSLARTVDVVVAFIYQVSFLDQPLDWTSLVGAAIVMTGVGVSGARKILQAHHYLCVPVRNRKRLFLSIMFKSYGSTAQVLKDQNVAEPESDHDDALVRKLRAIPLGGLLAAILSAFFFATASFTVTLAPNVHPVEAVMARSMAQLTVFGIVILLSGGSLKAPEGEKWPLFLRGFFGFITFGSSYASLHLLPIGDSSAIALSSPVYASIFACILVGEACGILDVVIIAITLSGVLLIAQPSFIFGHQDSPIDANARTQGTILAFISSIAMAFTFVMMRKLKKTPAKVIIAWFSIISIILGTIVLIGAKAVDPLIRLPNQFTLEEVLLLLGTGLCGVCGQFCLTNALKVEGAAIVSLARTVDIVVAFIYQVTFLAEPITATSLAGAAIVMLGVAISGTRKILQEKEKSRE
ncbi:Solute carrier family 35 member G1 [Halotydeus destructor]|nr:Solute carrier family 35 member G1 [Halotydeus destructor]